MDESSPTARALLTLELIQGSPGVRVTATIREVEDTRSFGPVAVEVRGGRATLRPALVRVVLGPELDKETLTVAELLRRGGVDRHVAVRPNADRVPAF